MSSIRFGESNRRIQKSVHLTAALLAAAPIVGYLWLFRAYPAPDGSRVEPRLLALREPFKKVRAYYYFDGGSIGIEITDADGKSEQFAIKGYLGSDEYRYKQVFAGGDHHTRPGAVEVQHPEETKQALIVVLSEYSHGDPALDWALSCLTDRFSSRLKVRWHALKGEYRPPPRSFKPQYSSKP